MDVASEHGWRTHPGLVLDFYNERRREISAAKPTAAHYGLAALQDDFDVHIVTTDIDDLQERAGSTHVIRLHGNIMKMRSEKAMPDIVWFGEPVPEIGPAAALAASADVFVPIGTTLSVYPAAGLVDFVRPETPKFPHRQQHYPHLGPAQPGQHREAGDPRRARPDQPTSPVPRRPNDTTEMDPVRWRTMTGWFFLTRRIG